MRAEEAKKTQKLNKRMARGRDQQFLLLPPRSSFFLSPPRTPEADPHMPTIMVGTPSRYISPDKLSSYFTHRSLFLPQAPLRSTKTQKMAVKKPSAGRGALSSSKSSVFGDGLRTNKKDKRQVKHAALMSKIEKSSHRAPKRRRASKKLVTNLESLADALPEAAEESNDGPSQVNVIKQKTLRHKAGAMKRREKLEKVERDRFAKNMAQMSGLSPANTDSQNEKNPDTESTTQRWSALRNFISQTMEQQPVFKTDK